jgi:hypothetical protein
MAVVVMVVGVVRNGCGCGEDGCGCGEGCL